MKSISKIYKKFINIDTSKKQITFALFALFLYLFFSKEVDTNITFSAVPAAVAAGLKAAGTAAKAGAKAGAIKGAASGALNKDEDESTLGAATKGAASGAARGAISGAKNSAVNSAKEAYNAKKGVDAANNISNANTPKTLQGNMGASNEINNKPSELDKDTSKDSKKESGKSQVDKEKKESKETKMTGEASLNDDSDDMESQEASSTILKKGNTASKWVGCFILIPLILIFGVPVIIISLIGGTSSAMGNIPCDTSGGYVCSEGSGDTTFFEKTKNFILYGSFKSNAEAIADKATMVYDTIYDKYNIEIDIPLLLATVMADSSIVKDEIDGESDLPKINTKISERIASLYDLGELQVKTESVLVVCKLKNENGVDTYYEETTPSEIDMENAIEGDCNETNVGKTLKKASNEKGIDGYYTKLEEKGELLGTIYGSEAVATESDLKLLIQKIKLQKDLFTIIYGGREIKEESCAGEIPMSLFYDSNVMLRTPTNEVHRITSPFGFRPAIYKDGAAITRPGLHNGIDIVASPDRTLLADGNGVVIYAKTNNTGSNMVKILHTTSDGMTYIAEYGHLKSFLVKDGDVVKAGDPIGIMGTTGISNGVHLHFSFYDNQQKKYLNPLNLFTEATNHKAIC